MRGTLAVLALSSAVLLAPPSHDSLAFAAAKGSSVRKTFECVLEMDLDTAQGTLGGEELPESVTDLFAMSLRHERRVEVVDEYVDVSGGRPLELVRRYETLEKRETGERRWPGSEPEEEDETIESELAGAVLRFAWNADSEVYDVAWVGDPGDEELLAGLEEDMDLRALLPDESVEVEESWQLDCEAVLGTLPPGGRLGFARESDDDLDLGEAFEGEAVATYLGLREEDGVRLAVIQIALEGQTEKHVEEEGGGARSLVLALDLDYELLWDVEEGRPAAVEALGGIGAVMVLAQDVEVGGEPAELDFELELSGTIEMAATFEEE